LVKAIGKILKAQRVEGLVQIAYVKQMEQQFPEFLEPQSTSRFLVWPFVNLHAIMRLKIHLIAPF